MISIAIPTERVRKIIDSFALAHNYKDRVLNPLFVSLEQAVDSDVSPTPKEIPNPETKQEFFEKQILIFIGETEKNHSPDKRAAELAYKVARQEVDDIVEETIAASEIISRPPLRV